MTRTTILPDAAPSSMARVNILSLTGQLQFIHSMSVLAETLSNIVNLPRKSGESAEDHIERLVARIRSLPPSERRVVEAQLNLMLQGATLKALAEALKNPSGPDAARLAVMLEMSRYKDRDLAAGAAVKSYRQNSGAELPGSTATGSRSGATTPSASKADTGATSHDNSTTRSNPASALQKASDIAARYIASQSSAQAMTASIATDAPGLITARSGAPRPQGETAGFSAIDAKNTGSEEIDTQPASAERLSSQTAASSPREKDVPPGKIPLSEATRADAMRNTEGADAQHETDDRVERSEARHGLYEDPRLAQKVAANLTQASQSNTAKGDSLTNFLLSVLVPGKAPTGATATPMALLPPGDEMTGEQLAPAKTDEITTGTPRSLSGSADAERPATADSRAASTTAQQADLARNMTIRPEQQSLQAGAMIAAVLGREAVVPLLYIAYLPAKDEPETPAQHRGNNPSGGEEEASGEEQQDEMQDEQTTDETEVSSADEDQDAGTEPQGAHDFYQRMSDWN